MSLLLQAPTLIPERASSRDERWKSRARAARFTRERVSRRPPRSRRASRRARRSAPRAACGARAQVEHRLLDVASAGTVDDLLGLASLARRARRCARRRARGLGHRLVVCRGAPRRRRPLRARRSTAPVRWVFFGDWINPGLRHAKGNASLSDVDLIPLPAYASKLDALLRLPTAHAVPTTRRSRFVTRGACSRTTSRRATCTSLLVLVPAPSSDGHPLDVRLRRSPPLYVGDTRRGRRPRKDVRRSENQGYRGFGRPGREHGAPPDSCSRT